MEMKVKCPGGYFKYEIKNDEAVITGYGERPYEVEIPEFIEGISVKRVARKAFMGCRSLRSISLPKGITAVGDYAFSSCQALLTVSCDSFPVFGQGCFKKSAALREVFIKGKERLSRLFATAATVMDAEYLLDESLTADDESFGSAFDAKARSILGEKDDEGFVFMVLCGEEDLTADIYEYMEDRRKRKAYISYLRLINNAGIQKEDEDIYKQYLISHTCGCESAAAFLVLLDNERDEEFVEKFLELGMLSEDNFNKILEALSDKHAPLKARMIMEHDKNKKDTDNFFSDFEL